MYHLHNYCNYNYLRSLVVVLDVEYSFDDGSGGGKRDDGILTDDEFEKFVQAVVDPYHEMWQTEEGKVDKEMWTEYTRNIVIERLTNGIKNSSYSEEGGDDDIDNIGK